MPKPQKHDFGLKLTRVIEQREDRALNWRPSKTLRVSRGRCGFGGRSDRIGITDYAAALVLKAATTGRQKDVAAATDQVERALRTDNWL